MCKELLEFSTEIDIRFDIDCDISNRLIDFFIKLFER